MPDHNDSAVDLARLRWQCRRGMLELDAILSRYLEECYAAAPATDQAQFRELLTIEDSVLNDWLILAHIPDDEPLAAIARQVRESPMH
jgi:antitoxin CptB